MLSNANITHIYLPLLRQSSDCEATASWGLPSPTHITACAALPCSDTYVSTHYFVLQPRHLLAHSSKLLERCINIFKNICFNIPALASSHLLWQPARPHKPRSWTTIAVVLVFAYHLPTLKPAAAIDTNLLELLNTRSFQLNCLLSLRCLTHYAALQKVSKINRVRLVAWWPPNAFRIARYHGSICRPGTTLVRWN